MHGRGRSRVGHGQVVYGVAVGEDEIIERAIHQRGQGHAADEAAGGARFLVVLHKDKITGGFGIAQQRRQSGRKEHRRFEEVGQRLQRRKDHGQLRRQRTRIQGEDGTLGGLGAWTEQTQGRSLFRHPR